MTEIKEGTMEYKQIGKNLSFAASGIHHTASSRRGW